MSTNGTGRHPTSPSLTVSVLHRILHSRRGYLNARGEAVQNATAEALAERKAVELEIRALESAIELLAFRVQGWT